MSDRGRILLGLIVALAVLTLPIWLGAVRGGDARRPELELPADETQCVAETDYMRAEHMQVLMDWRDEVVRDSDRTLTTSDGRRFEKSLSRTCMKCHYNKDEFCDRCHDYAAMSPYCWDCHVEPQEAE